MKELTFAAFLCGLCVSVVLRPLDFLLDQN
jgi:hypothetical protein